MANTEYFWSGDEKRIVITKVRGARQREFFGDEARAIRNLMNREDKEFRQRVLRYSFNQRTVPSVEAQYGIG